MNEAAAAAVRLAERIFELRDMRVLCIGGAEAVARMAERFAARRPRALERRAAAPEALEDYDVVVCGAGSPVPLIEPERVRRALRARKRRPILMVDLAADIDPQVAGFEDVFFYTGKDLA